MAKVISLRLKEVLDDTIDQTQGAFVKGRQITDLILVANEVVEEYRGKKKEGLVFKIDFEKAYDHVCWDFLDFVLEKKGFGERWRKWIRGCLSSTNFSVIINGKPRGRFWASKGLRQGDPLSPFLFILEADVLSRLVKKAVEADLIEGLVVGSNKVKISHLQFADDSIFFLSNRINNVSNLVGILDIFSRVSGLRINMSKSNVAGINMESDCIDRIAAEVGCDRGSWPMNYLGMPLGGNPNSLAFWDPVIERISRKLEGWHKGCLSRGGRLTLLQAVLGSMPVYLMSVFRMPGRVVETIEMMMRNFFWEGREDNKRNHLVRWEVVSLPKKCGGLGVGNLKYKNMALLGKWLWRFPLESKSLWHSIILSKYGNHSNGWDVNTVFNASLRSPWKSIARIWEKYMENIKLVTGRGG